MLRYPFSFRDRAFPCFSGSKVNFSILFFRLYSTTGFEKLAEKTSLPSKSLHRMLSAKGNPTMNNLTAIFNVLRQQLNVNLEVQGVSCDR